jgi:phosphohistidine phosphatase SixA
MRRLKRIVIKAMVVLLVGWAASSAAIAEEPSGGLSPELLAELRAGGLNIFFRHGKTPNYSDPDDSDLDNCATQRNLSKEGIDQSIAIGEAIRELGLPIGIVRASPYCRCIDTAWHAFGRVEKDRALRLSGKEPDQDAGEVKVWRHLRNMARILPMPGTNSFFVSHGTVGEVFGTGYLDEGEAVVVRPDGKGGWRPVARIKSDEWRAM